MDNIILLNGDTVIIGNFKDILEAVDESMGAILRNI